MTFSLELNEDQIQLQKWVHDFAENVVRPVAGEYDRKEETPWPVIEEAAKIGLYSFDFFANAFADETGLTIPVVMEELFWGDAGIGLSIVGSVLGVAGIMANGTPEQVMEWVPQCFGTPEKVTLGAFCVSEPDAGSDVSSLRTKAVYDEAKDEWVLNGTKTWITNGGIADVHVVVATVDPTLGSRGQASFIVPPGTRGPEPGHQVLQDGHPGQPHRRGRPRRRAGAGLAAARRQGETGRPHGRGPGGQEERRPGRHGHLRGHPPVGGRAGRRHRPGRLRVRPAVRRWSASSSGRPSSRTSPSPSCWPT